MQKLVEEHPKPFDKTINDFGFLSCEQCTIQIESGSSILTDQSEMKPPQIPETERPGHSYNIMAPGENQGGFSSVTRDEARQEIKKRWREIYPLSADGKGIICPICGHGSHGDGIILNKGSSDPYGLKCFGCGFSGDIIALVQEDKAINFIEAVAYCAEQLGISIDRNTGEFEKSSAPKTQKKQEPQEMQNEANQTADYTEYYKVCQRRLDDPKAISYLSARGISRETAEKFGIGFDPDADPAKAPGATNNERRPYATARIILPISKSFYIGRAIDNTEKFRYANSTGGTAELFNKSALYNPDNKAVFITEGVFDALAVSEANAAAIALNSVGNANKLVSLLSAKKPDAVLILALDADQAGRQVQTTLAEAFKRLDLTFTVMDIPEGFKDCNEALNGNTATWFSAVESAYGEALAEKERRAEEVRRAEEERRRRTGAEMVDTFLEAVQGRKYEPIPTNINDIDKAIGGGFIRQQLVLLGAEPGAGKTALAQQIFEGMAKHGTPCIYLNLEMSQEQMLSRSIARISAKNGFAISPVNVLKGYEWNDLQRNAVMKAAEEYKETIAPRMIYNPDGIGTNLDKILSHIETEAKRSEAAGQQAPLVVLDYLQIITGNQREDDTTLIKRAVSELKNYAVRHSTVVFAIMAQSRSVNSAGRPTMEAGRDSSALEYTADLQLNLTFTKCLHRAGGKNRDDLTKEDRQYKTLTITKGRFATPGAEVDLFFNGESMSFNQLDILHIEPQKPHKPTSKLG